MTGIICKVYHCKYNKEKICIKKEIKINAYGKCLSFIHKNIRFHTKEIDYNRVKIESCIKQKKDKIVVVKRINV